MVTPAEFDDNIRVERRVRPKPEPVSPSRSRRDALIRSLPLARPAGFVHVARLPAAPFRIPDFLLPNFYFLLSTFEFLRIGTHGEYNRFRF